MALFTRKVTTNLSQDAYNGLIEVCNKTGWSESEAIRNAVDFWLLHDSQIEPGTMRSIRMRMIAEAELSKRTNMDLAISAYKVNRDEGLLNLILEVCEDEGLEVPGELLEEIE